MVFFSLFAVDEVLDSERLRESQAEERRAAGIFDEKVRPLEPGLEVGFNRSVISIEGRD